LEKAADNGQSEQAVETPSKLLWNMGNVLVCFAWSIAAAYIVALAVWPLLISGTKLNLVGTVLAIIGISVCPALIPPDHSMARAFSCLWCLDSLFRVLDCARQLRKRTANPVAWRAYWTFLIPFPFLLTVFGQKRRISLTLHDNRADLIRCCGSLAVTAMALLLCVQSHHIEALRESFLLDYLTKLVLFAVGVEAASQCQVALERLSGYSAPPLINQAYLARTPAEFWFRYNQRVRQWLHANVFVPCGGRRSPLTGIVAVFLFSAIFHEFFFSLALSQLEGYQFAFFVLQIPAVLVSPQLERLAARGVGGRFVAHGLTWLWFAGTSPLFFHGLDRVFPVFYVSRPWLP
jgi:hypothetical protein